MTMVTPATVGVNLKMTYGAEPAGSDLAVTYYLNDKARDQAVPRLRGLA
jgi:hypothetical protein